MLSENPTFFGRLLGLDHRCLRNKFESLIVARLFFVAADNGEWVAVIIFVGAINFGWIFLGVPLDGRQI